MGAKGKGQPRLKAISKLEPNTKHDPCHKIYWKLLNTKWFRVGQLINFSYGWAKIFCYGARFVHKHHFNL